jgi:uncharacterized membrane protein YdcZ (DUF606 family)
LLGRCSNHSSHSTSHISSLISFLQGINLLFYILIVYSENCEDDFNNLTEISFGLSPYTII